MKSRTSSCKAAALRKDFGRFWPVWAGYTLFLILMQVMLRSNANITTLSYRYANEMANFTDFMGLVNCGYGLIVAQTLFGDLFNARMCNGLHSLPLRREHWFSVHLTAGFLFSLIPTALVVTISEALMTGSIVAGSWQIPLYWWLGSNLQYLFFFGLAVFSAMCVGSRFAMAVVYGILNFFSLLFYILADQIFVPLLPGVICLSAAYTRLCPVYMLAEASLLTCHREPLGTTYTDAYGVEQPNYTAYFQVNWENWGYLVVLVVLGLVLLVIARQMYRKRHLECAGDFLAVRWLVPIFQVVFTVLCAAGFQGVFTLFLGWTQQRTYLILYAGLLVGWFACTMLLERSTRVFRWKTILGFGLMALVLAGSMYLTKLDPLGIATYVPQDADVEGLNMSISYRSTLNADDPEDIAKITRLHRLALEEQIEVHPDYDDSYHSSSVLEAEAVNFELVYHLDNGSIKARTYSVPADSQSGQLLKELGSRLEVVIGNPEVETLSDLKDLMRDAEVIYVSSARLESQYLTEDFLNDLAEAIAADCEAQTLVQSAAYHPDMILDYEHESDDLYAITLDIFGGEKLGIYLSIYADSTHTLEVLEGTNVMDDLRESIENAYG